MIQSLRGVKLVIFDLDGTLVDSAHDIAASANHALDKLGLPPIPEARIKSYVGNGLKALVERLAPHRKDDPAFLKSALEAFHEHYGRNLINRTVLFDGVRGFLDAWPRGLAVVTNKTEAYARRILDQLDVGEARFIDIVGGDRFESKKPDPVQVRHVLGLASVQPHEAVLVGDGVQDVGAARAAGIHSISVTFGYNTVEQLKASGASHFIDHFDELRALLPG